MGCTPSIHVSDTGVIFCKDATDDSPSAVTNHQMVHSSFGQQHSFKQGVTTQSPGKVSGGSREGRHFGEDDMGSGIKPLPPPTAEVRFGPMRLMRPPLKVLMVFAKEDGTNEALQWAADKLRYDCSIVRTPDAANETFRDGQHDIVLVDCRHSKHFDGEAVCRSIRNAKQGPCQHTVIVAVVKKSFIEREDAPILPLLSAGFNRVWVESSNSMVCVNELLQLEHGEVLSHIKLAAASSLFAALDNCRDLVQITDRCHNIQYVNRSWEKLVGYSREDVLGRSVQELHHMKPDGMEAVAQQLATGRDWEGVFTCRRRTGDLLPLFCWIVPSPPLQSSQQQVAITASTGQTNTQSSPSALHTNGTRAMGGHFIYIKEPPPLFVEKSSSGEMATDVYPLPRGSLRSLRKASYDIKSLSSDVKTRSGSFSIIRRQSLAKLHSLTIEAPITKVINIISAAQENSPIYIAQALEKVLDILRTTELYSPQLFEGKVKAEDQMTTDLLGALLSQGPKPVVTNRRSSNESAIKGYSHMQQQHTIARPSLPTINNAPVQIRQLLESESCWDFDIIRLEELSNKRPLVWLGMTTMVRFQVPKVLGCDETTLQNWLTLIEANYHSSNTYHNSTHAADVLQATAFFLDRDRLKQILDPLDEAICLIAAAVHDVDHPGKSSAFLSNSSNELAILYNDRSVLESHHAALSFKLAMSDERVNIFKGLDRDTYKVVRQSIIDMVLATEMTKHFEHLSKFINLFAKTPVRDDDDLMGAGLPEGTSSLGVGVCPRESVDLTALLSTPENIVLIKRMLIKCADVSNPTRPLTSCVEWAKRIAEEYCAQTDEEKTRGLPVVMPMFDRSSCSIPKSQIGFVDYFVNDMFDTWDAFADTPELIEHMKRNYQYWKDQDQAQQKTHVSAQPVTTTSTAATQKEEVKED